MSALNYLVLFGCILCIAAGQLLLKAAATTPHERGWTGLLLSPALLGGLVVYGAAMVIWIWQLRTVPLTRAFPFMALGFILTPLAASLLFHEATSPRYWLGAFLICLGIILSITDPV